MTEIKVNNWPEILSKIKELVDQDNNWRVENYYWMGVDFNEKARQGVKLIKNGEYAKSIDIFIEVEEDFSKSAWVGSERVKEYIKWIEEIDKIIPGMGANYQPQPPTLPIPPTPPQEPQSPQPYTPPTNPQEPVDIRDKNVRGISSRFVGCHNLEAAKKFIKEYYQENQTEIQKNPDFAHWVRVKKQKWHSGRGSFICVHVGNVVRRPSDLPGWQKKVMENMEYLYESELTLSLGDRCGEDTAAVEKELENYWNSLVGKKGNENTPTENSTDKNTENKVQQLKLEIQELENNLQTNHNSQTQKELEDKKRKLEELENENNANTSNKPDKSSLPIYLSIGAIVLLISSIFVWKLFNKRKKK